MPNPPLTIAALLGLPTAATIRAQIVNWLVGVGIRADLWPAGDVASSIVTDFAEEGGTVFAPIIQAAVAAGWLPTASGGWLKWLAVYVYGVDPIEATFASGAVKLTNSGGGVYNYQPFQVTFQNLKTKETYQNTQAISLGAGPGATQTVNVQCVDAGTVGNAAPGDVSVLVTSLPGVDVSNALPILGIDAQTDDALRAMCFSSLGARSVRGPRTAYEFAIAIATNASTGSPVNINRNTISPASHVGEVDVLVASPQGAPDPGDVTGVATAIEAVARPQGVVVTVAAAVAALYGSGQTLTVWCSPQPGLVAATVQSAVAAALDAFFSSKATSPIGGLTADGLTGIHGTGVDAAVGAAFPGIFAVDSPGDLPLASNQVATNAILVSNIIIRFASA
jgi:hypothetical protein